ncbi:MULTISPECIES: hypothetical protein [Thermus]|uniref:Uncharacterized protein n=1 Tax=Thermus scotoductus TaxID=37636 RepID=A0A430S3J4_THESC|nr:MULTISPECIES: hypothetical protein [Thermus]QWK21381.1 MAG: regulatory protein GemA [Thermus antranikianii]RTH05164.1 hypothetical protein CSW50_00985 [Thermus scotoductus]RTH28399.1 hypothetical protein CSW40_00955 [Thermus scotoductus]RTI41779.1 hypothetical protein CSW18_02700 [Thermus scotoductus]
MTKPISNPSKRQEAPKFPATPRRKALLARVHALAKELGLEGDAYRLVLRALTGKPSCALMTEEELLEAARGLEALRREGEDNSAEALRREFGWM